jgi:MYXO-CTERM domain-containing protein
MSRSISGSFRFGSTYLGKTPDIVHSGEYGLGLANSVSNHTVFQMLPTVPGAPYQLSFWLSSSGNHAPDDYLFVSVGNTAAFNFSAMPYQPLTQYQYLFTANSTTSNLVFGYQAGSYYYGVDDVSVVEVGAAVPKPTSAALLGLGALAMLVRRRCARPERSGQEHFRS